ncbi:transposase [Roseomonas marmotae]|uniref:Transposase n=1 Tax=Roseomonas marmotae TaxID=2768161 RepID=A0ABS3KE29_9PROT|nr:transposase [Roseomonas marmotae]MBO1075690.1 transposase [Roseomonas marmotae]QTI79546.1 transposase [Roseomonas marmotae]
MSSLTIFTRWTPLSDPAWTALQPFLPTLAPQGRRTADLRQRLDAIFHLAHQPGDPWKYLPERFGRPETVARFFRRLVHDGFWHRLLRALAAAPLGHPLRALEHSICRACRRAARLGGLPLLVLIRRLNLRAALNGPPWLLPDPLLSETLHRLPLNPRWAPDALRSLLRLARNALGRASIPRSVRLAWV